MCESLVAKDELWLAAYEIGRFILLLSPFSLVAHLQMAKVAKKAKCVHACGTAHRQKCRGERDLARCAGRARGGKSYRGAEKSIGSRRRWALQPKSSTTRREEKDCPQRPSEEKLWGGLGGSIVPRIDIRQRVAHSQTHTSTPPTTHPGKTSGRHQERGRKNHASEDFLSPCRSLHAELKTRPRHLPSSDLAPMETSPSSFQSSGGWGQ